MTQIVQDRGISISKTILNTTVWFVLVVGGMCLAGEIPPDMWFYAPAVALCFLPASLFMKFTLPISWRRFIVLSLLIFCIVMMNVILERYGVESKTIMSIVGVILILTSIINSRQWEKV